MLVNRLIQITKSIFKGYKDNSDILGSIPQIVVAGLAFYGLFFTSIPESIYRQLSNEANRLKESNYELITKKTILEEDNARISSDTNDAKAKLLSYETQLVEYKYKIDALTKEKHILDNDISSLNKQKDEYFISVQSFYIAGISLAVMRELQDFILHNQNVKAIYYLPILRKEDSENKKIVDSIPHTPDNMPKIYKIIEAYSNNRKEKYRNLTSEIGYVNLYNDLFRSSENTNEADTIRNLISIAVKESAATTTCGEIIKKKVGEMSLRYFTSEKDKKKFLKYIDDFIYENGEILNKRLNPVINNHYNTSEILEAANIAKKNLLSAAETINTLCKRNNAPLSPINLMSGEMLFSPLRPIEGL